MIAKSGRKSIIDAKDENGITSLGYATLKGHVEVTEFLLLNKAKPDIPDNLRSTPLHNAVISGENKNYYIIYNITKLLLNHRAITNVINSVGITPLHLAAQNGNKKVQKLLLEKTP